MLTRNPTFLFTIGHFMNIKTLYEQDFYSWIQHHVALLKDSRFDEIDVDNLIEELEGMAKKDERELISRLIILIAHLLKWQSQSDMQSNSWSSSIIEQHAQVLFLLENVPGLKNTMSELFLGPILKLGKLPLKKPDYPVFQNNVPTAKSNYLMKIFILTTNNNP